MTTNNDTSALPAREQLRKTLIDAEYTYSSVRVNLRAVLDCLALDAMTGCLDEAAVRYWSAQLHRLLGIYEIEQAATLAADQIDALDEERS